MWNKYEAAARRLGQLNADSEKQSAAAGGAEEFGRERQALRDTLQRLRPWTYRRKQFRRYMAKRAGAIAPSPHDAELEAAVEAAVRELQALGHDLRARAAELVPEDLGVKLGSEELGRRRKEWHDAVETLLRDAAQEQARTGIS